MNKIKDFLSETKDLKIKIYYVILFIGSFANFISLIADLMQGLDKRTILSAFACFLFLIGLLHASIRYHIENVGKYLLVYFFNCLFFPLTFITGGGISSGMLLCYMLALFVLGLLLEKKARIIAYIICILVLEFSIIISYIKPDLVDLLDYKSSVIDITVTLLITSATIVVILSMILNAYDNERRTSQQLNNRLRELSVKDELSGLYNRRELFRKLDSIYRSEVGDAVPSSKEDCYIAMFDIDDFKLLNDEYGHQFGDKVLSEIANVFIESTNEDNGELAARYGGEEFVCIIRANNPEDALSRVEKMRTDILKIRWEEAPKLVVTISGGLIGCEGYDDLRVTIHDVDALLYKAKREGKNQIKL